MKNILSIALVVVLSAFNSLLQSQDKGLIVSYLFNGDAKDQSMYNNHGSLKGSLLFGQDRFGNDCGAAEFDGKTSYILVPSSRSLESPLNQISITVWFKTHKKAHKMQWFTIVCKGTSNQENAISPQYRLQGTRMTLSLNTAFTENINLPIQHDVWYHYAMTWDGKVVRSYLNGREVFNFPYNGNLNPNNENLLIGRDIPGVEEMFHGSMDQLQIYNRAISAKEINIIFKDQSEKTSTKPCGNSNATNPDSTKTEINSDSVTVSSQGKKPEVDILNPSNGITVNTGQNAHLIAHVKNVANKRNIQVIVNGKPVSSFNYDQDTDIVDADIQLKTGKNDIEVRGENNKGKDQDKVQIITIKPAVEVIKPPHVTIIDPAKTGSEIHEDSYAVKAQTNEINSKNEISIFLNDHSLRSSDFRWDNHEITVECPLTEGANFIEIVVVNKHGKDKDITSIIYKPLVYSPEIVFISPASFPASSDAQSKKVTANIKHVKHKKDITVIHNGIENPFSFDSNSGLLTTDLKLENGYNLIEIKGKNEHGNDHAIGQIKYSPINAAMKNLNLGKINIIEDISLPSKDIIIHCYDHNKIDGDSVSVILNDEILFDRIVLKSKSEKESIKQLKLDRGATYTLISKAWNEGKIATNTLCIEISDSNGFSKIVKLNSKKNESEAISFTYN